MDFFASYLPLRGVEHKFNVALVAVVPSLCIVDVDIAEVLQRTSSYERLELL